MSQSTARNTITLPYTVHGRNLGHAATRQTLAKLGQALAARGGQWPKGMAWNAVRGWHYTREQIDRLKDLVEKGLAAERGATSTPPPSARPVDMPARQARRVDEAGQPLLWVTTLRQ